MRFKNFGENVILWFYQKKINLIDFDKKICFWFWLQNVILDF